MNNPSESRILIVEGTDDLHSICHLMGYHIEWPDSKADAPVQIKIGKSDNEILNETFLTVTLKSRDVRIVGIMIDADDNPLQKYERIRKLLQKSFPELPDGLPPEGLIIDGEDKRLGVWVMPDNQANGGLEIFLRGLVPDTSEPLWQHAVLSVDKARELGAAIRDSHIDKANLYTWLSWQDPPGRSPGLALKKSQLDPHSVNATPFVKWFRELYGL